MPVLRSKLRESPCANTYSQTMNRPRFLSGDPTVALVGSSCQPNAFGTIKPKAAVEAVLAEATAAVPLR
jgi:hypothetical protein